MKVIEEQKNLGMMFIVIGDIDDVNEISRWLIENNIQYISDYPRRRYYRYFIKDETSIMAFKLRWL